jgi:oxygen-independent coproporphyrinogen-3 oxidase
MIEPVDPDHGATLFELTREATAAAGLPAYEISNHARPGEESRHNLAYWRYADYLGVGPGAHGRRGGHATFRARKPENWLTRIDAHGHGIEHEEPLDAATRATEALLMGLRLEEGVARDRIARAVDEGAVRRLAGLGLIEQDESRLRVLPRGMLLLDAILREIAV